MPETFTLVHLLNTLFMGAEVKAFQSIGYAPVVAVEKAVNVNQAFGLELLVGFGLIAFFIILRLTLSVEKPNPAQNIAMSASRPLSLASSSSSCSTICWG